MIPDTPGEFLRLVVFGYVGLIVLITLGYQILRGGL